MIYNSFLCRLVTLESRKTRQGRTPLAKFHCTTFHSVFAPNSAFAAKPAEPCTPNPCLSNAKQHRLLLLSTDAAMQASVSASVSRRFLGSDAPALSKDLDKCKFAETSAAIQRTGKNRQLRRVTGQSHEHESVLPSICFAFRDTSTEHTRSGYF